MLGLPEAALHGWPTRQRRASLNSIPMAWGECWDTRRAVGGFCGFGFGHAGKGGTAETAHKLCSFPVVSTLARATLLAWVNDRVVQALD